MTFDFGECSFDAAGRTLRRAGLVVPLSGKAFELLRLLLAERPRPVKKEELMERLWPDTFVAEANLPSLVKEIRDAIGDDAREPRFIRTAHRFGYAFVAEVRERDDQNVAIDSVVVLPLVLRTTSETLELLAEGIVESLTNSLSRLSSLRVTPRTTSLNYSGETLDAAKIRRELKVDAAITGTLKLKDERISVQIEITDLRRDSQLWGSRFDVALNAALDLQEQIVREVTQQLHVATPADVRRRRYPLDYEAYQQYLRGRHHWNRRTAEGIEKAIAFFEASIQHDANFAPAYSGLADSYISLASRDLQRPDDLFSKAESAAKRALQLDPELAEAHASLGAIHEIFRWQWRDAERSYVESLRLNPSYVTGRMWYALGLAHQKRFEESRRQFDIASEVDPLSFVLNAQRGVGRYLARRYSDAVTECMKSVEINPYHEPAHFVLGLAQQQLGDFSAARTELERAHTISKGEPHVEAALGALAAAAGDDDEARRRFESLQRMSHVRHVSDVHFAAISTALGEIDRALDCLAGAVEGRSGWLVYIGTDPRFDALRGEARFAGILRATGHT